MSKIQCPAWLDEEAKKEWKRIIKNIDDDLTDKDLKALEGYTQSYSKWKKCEEILQEHGYTFTTPNGYVQQRPEISIANKALADMRAWAKELGFTPAARYRMLKNSGDADSDDSEMEDMVVK